jgi:hypothetical protein
VKKGLSEKSKIVILIPTNELDSVENKNKLSTDLSFRTAPSSKEKAIMGAVSPKPPLSAHLHSKLLHFLAFSHDLSFSTPSS